MNASLSKTWTRHGTSQNLKEISPELGETDFPRDRRVSGNSVSPNRIIPDAKVARGRTRVRKNVKSRNVTVKKARARFLSRLSRGTGRSLSPVPALMLASFAQRGRAELRSRGVLNSPRGRQVGFFAAHERLSVFFMATRELRPTGRLNSFCHAAIFRAPDAR